MGRNRVESGEQLATESPTPGPHNITACSRANRAPSARLLGPAALTPHLLCVRHCAKSLQSSVPQNPPSRGLSWVHRKHNEICTASLYQGHRESQRHLSCAQQDSPTTGASPAAPELQLVNMQCKPGTRNITKVRILCFSL